MNWTHEKRLISAFWLAFALLVFFRLISLQSNFKVVEANALVTQTRQRLTALSDVESGLFFTETARRGYVITRNDGFLEQYTNATDTLEKTDLPKLRALIAENPVEREMLDQMELLILLKTAQLNKSIALHKAGTNDSAAQISFTAEGRDLMERIEPKIQQIREIETGLLENRAAEVQNRLQQRTMLSLALSVLDLLLLIFAYRSLRRYIRERKRIEQVLYEESQLRAAIVNAQYEIATAELDSSKILNLVVYHAQVLTNAEGAMIKLRHDYELVCDMASGQMAGGLGSRNLIKESISGWVLESGQTYRTGDIRNDPRARKDYGEFGIRSLLITNLCHDNRSVGVLEVFSTRPRAFSEREVQTLEFMAGLMAAAMTNATNYESAKKVSQLH